MQISLMSLDEFQKRYPGELIPHKLAEELRVPLISCPYPRWCYITAVVVSQEPHLWHGLLPTDDELRAVASYHQAYLDYWYNPGWIKQMANRPYDVDGSANGRILIKYPHGGWAYRRVSWRSGCEFVPQRDQEPPFSLLAVLDREQTIGKEPAQRWQQWKGEHAEVFAALES